MKMYRFKCPKCGDESNELVMDADVQPLCMICLTFKERIVEEIEYEQKETGV